MSSLTPSSTRLDGGADPPSTEKWLSASLAPTAKKYKCSDSTQAPGYFKTTKKVFMFIPFPEWWILAERLR